MKQRCMHCSSVDLWLYCICLYVCFTLQEKGQIKEYTMGGNFTPSDTRLSSFSLLVETVSLGSKRGKRRGEGVKIVFGYYCGAVLGKSSSRHVSLVKAYREFHW